MEKQKNLCETCKNKLQIEYLEIPFTFDKRTGEQVNGKNSIIYEASCIYFNSRRESALDHMLIIKCNQYKPNGNK